MPSRTAKSQPSHDPAEPGGPLLARLYAAGAGAVGRAQGELDVFLRGLVERGALAREDATRILRELTAPARKTAPAAPARKRVDDAIAATLRRFRPATRADLAALDRRLKTIEQKLDRALARRR